MKKLVLLSAIAMSGLLYTTADAQIGIHIGFRLFPHRVIAAPGPVVVQDIAYQQPEVCAGNADDFYYLPDLGVYYSVTEQLYYYFDGENWIATAYLPGIYRDFDWRYARRFEIREARPYLNNDFYRNRYQGFDRDLAHNQNGFRDGYNFRNNRDAYNAPQRVNDQGFDHRFDNNRNVYDQKFDNRVNDNRFDNTGQAGFNKMNNGDARDNKQFDQNRDKGNFDGQQARQDKGKNDKQDRFAQNERGYDGHKDGMRDRF